MNHLGKLVFIGIFVILLNVFCNGQVPEKPVILIPGEDVKLENIEKTDYPSHVIVDQALQMSKNNQGNEAFAILEERMRMAEGYDKGYVKSRMGYVKLNSGDDYGSLMAFRDIIEGNVPAREDIKCDALLRSAYLQMRMNNDEKALEGFYKIASGEHKVDAFTATDASMRMGFLFKKQKKFKEAIEVFWQVSQKCPFKDDADYARLLVAGELWESGMGFYEKHLSLTERMRYYKESLKVCNIILNDPTVRDEIRIITELIQLEDYFFQGEYDTVKNLGESFLQKWTPRLQDMTNKKVYGKTWNITNCPRRQIITAQMWMGMTCFMLGEYDECIEICQKVNSDMWTPEDPYGNFNVFGEAILFEAMSWEKLGDYTKSENLKQICGEKYPEWFNVTGKAILDKHQPITSFSDSLY